MERCPYCLYAVGGAGFPLFLRQSFYADHGLSCAMYAWENGSYVLCDGRMVNASGMVGETVAIPAGNYPYLTKNYPYFSFS